jgi:hypothetical protein
MERTVVDDPRSQASVKPGEEFVGQAATFGTHKGF